MFISFFVPKQNYLGLEASRRNSDLVTRAAQMLTRVRRPLHCAINPLNAELNPICHLLALLRAHHILHVNR
jgi:hypothetical protein